MFITYYFYETRIGRGVDSFVFIPKRNEIHDCATLPSSLAFFFLSSSFSSFSSFPVLSFPLPLPLLLLSPPLPGCMYRVSSKILEPRYRVASWFTSYNTDVATRWPLYDPAENVELIILASNRFHDLKRSTGSQDIHIRAFGVEPERTKSCTSSYV